MHCIPEHWRIEQYNIAELPKNSIPFRYDNFCPAGASIETFATEHWPYLGCRPIYYGLTEQCGSLLEQPIGSTKGITVTARAAAQTVDYICEHCVAIRNATVKIVACFCSESVGMERGSNLCAGSRERGLIIRSEGGLSLLELLGLRATGDRSANCSGCLIKRLGVGAKQAGHRWGCWTELQSLAT